MRIRKPRWGWPLLLVCYSLALCVLRYYTRFPQMERRQTAVRGKPLEHVQSQELREFDFAAPGVYAPISQSLFASYPSWKVRPL
jgi:hypothetical protein